MLSCVCYAQEKIKVACVDSKEKYNAKAESGFVNIVSLFNKYGKEEGPDRKKRENGRNQGKSMKYTGGARAYASKKIDSHKEHSSAYDACGNVGCRVICFCNKIFLRLSPK